MNMNAMRRVPAPDGAIRIGNSRSKSQAIRCNSRYIWQFKLPARGQHSENQQFFWPVAPPLKFYEWHEGERAPRNRMLSFLYV